MGCEDFRVTLRSSMELGAAHRHLLADARIVSDPEGGPLPQGCYLAYDDGEHLIELELYCVEPRIELSVRFALCNPDSVDNAFIDLVMLLAERLDAEVSVMENISPGVRGDFSPSELGPFSEIVKPMIAKKRAYWIADFGTERAPISCNEALRRFVMRLSPSSLSK